MPLSFKASWLPAKLRSVLTFQIVIFIVTFCLYAAVHAVRKTISNGTSVLYSLGYSKAFYGFMTSAFMLSYAIGMVFTGALGDRFRPTTVLLIASVGIAIVQSALGLLFPHFTATSYWAMYVFIGVLSGIFQSCVWPVEVKLMSRWFPGNHSGAVFGIWSANSSVGNILGVAFSAMCFNIFGENSQGLTWSFLVPSIVLVGIGLMTFILPVTKAEAGFKEDSDESSTEAEEEEETGDVEKPSQVVVSANTDAPSSEKVSMWTAWTLPGVVRYSLCYACIKSVNYTVFYCLKPILTDLGYTSNDAFMVNIWNDVGWIFGGFACGFVSDKMGVRSPIVGLFILLGIAPTALMYPCSSSFAATCVMSLLNGFFAGGSGNVVASACCADIGKSENIKKVVKNKDEDSLKKANEDLVGQVSGIVDGVGALGAALCQIVMNYIPQEYTYVIFYTLAGLLLVSLLLIGDLVYRETLGWLRARRASCRKSKMTAACATEEPTKEDITTAVVG